MKQYLLTLSLIFLSSFLVSVEIDTFYGPIEVKEPVLLELIESQAMQRLKEIHQYGVSHYTTHKENYNRYDHSLGVFAILRVNQAPLKEQIAGLLHDVSHTIFSHVGDWIFDVLHQENDYQCLTHTKFLKERGLEDILIRHGYCAEEMLPTHDAFPALECSLPRLCADRIDYNIQGAFYQGFISCQEAVKAFNSLKFADGNWVSTRPDLMMKLASFALYMSQDCWASPTNYLQSRWLANAILRACELGVLDNDTIHFGTDDQAWNALLKHEDPIIQHMMNLVLHADEAFEKVSPSNADLRFPCKFRGIDPLISHNGKVSTLCQWSKKASQRHEKVKAIMKQGCSIKLVPQNVNLL